MLVFFCVLVVILLIVAVRFFFPLVVIHGDSMEPAMHDREVYLGRRILFKKRLLPRDFFRFKNRVFVLRPPNYTDPEHRNHAKRLVHVDEFQGLWFEGDNARVSYDSRYYGYALPKHVVVILLRRVH